MDNKKIIFYAGGALVLGAVTFFVWSFFQKTTIPIGDTTVALGEQTPSEEEEPIAPVKNPFADLANVQFPEIKTPDIASNLESLIRGR